MQMNKRNGFFAMFHPSFYLRKIGLIGLLWVVMLSSCYHRPAQKSEALIPLSQDQVDSLHFYSSHHYTNNYNFIVKSDSLVLFEQQPEEVLSGLLVDTLVLKRHSHVVVADIRMLPTDSVDSVWVQLASDQHTFGWIHETQLLPSVVPDDPISQFISTFSDTHLLIFFIVISLIAIAYWMRRLFKEKAWIVHFKDIPSFYPTLLCIMVAIASTLYASIQNFAPDMWRHFYYHPTLNPFSVPGLLMVFLCMVWGMLIVGLAAVDDVRHRLPFTDAVMYLSGLLAVCAVNYIVFGLTTLYYIGYPLLLLYVVFAMRQYLHHARPQYVCGHCGQPIPSKGRCPHCGAYNA